MAKKKKKYFVGIDIGGTKFLVLVLDARFRVLSAVKAKVDLAEGRSHFLDSITESVEEALYEARVDARKVGAIGIGCPGLIDHQRGFVLSSPNIPFLKNYPLREKIGRRLHTHAVIENDVNAGLYGEHQFGAARGHREVLGIFLGTGVGGALILNGRLHRGVSGAAGEIGHMIINKLGPRCGCGQKGCLEAFIGRTAIAAEAAAFAARQQAPALFRAVGTEVLKIKSGVLAKSILAGDKKIENLVREKARLLGITLANAANLLNPDLIVLGGGMIEAMGKIIVPEAAESMHQHALAPASKRLKIVSARLKDYAVAMGAAKLAMDDLK